MCLRRNITNKVAFANLHSYFKRTKNRVQMRIEIQKRSLKELEIGIAYLVIMAFGSIIIKLFPGAFDLVPPCLFRLWTGIPCPACGGTHCGLHLAQLNIYQAFLANPFIFLLLMLLFLWGMNTLAGIVIKKNFRFFLTKIERKYLYSAILLAIPLNWAFLILKVVFLKQ